MSWRITEEDVRGIIDSDADLSVAPFINTANALTDYVSDQDSASSLGSALLKQIELFLSAHFYEHLDPQYASQSTEKASATYQGQFKLGLEGSKWGQTAMMLDVSGTLAGLNRGRRRVSLAWLGYPPSSQTAVTDRD